MQTQLYGDVFARISSLKRGIPLWSNASNTYFRLLAYGRVVSIKSFELLLWKQLDRPRVIFLQFIMAKKQHSSNTSRHNRKKLITNLKEAVLEALCRRGGQALIWVSLSCVAELALKERTLEGLTELKLPYHQRQIQTKTVIISSKEAKDLLEQIFVRQETFGHALISCGFFVFEGFSGLQWLLYFFFLTKNTATSF